MIGLSNIDYSVIGLLFLVINLGTSLASMVMSGMFPKQTVLTEEERNCLITLYKMHQAKDPNTGVPLWYNPPQFLESMVESTKALTRISAQLDTLIKESENQAQADKDSTRTIIRRIENLEK
jgi:hypothetical protein